MQQALGVFHINTRYPETFGCIHAEANAVGTPVITLDIGANREVIHPVAEQVLTEPTPQDIEIASSHGGVASVRLWPTAHFHPHRIAHQWMQHLSLALPSRGLRVASNNAAGPKPRVLHFRTGEPMRILSLLFLLGVGCDTPDNTDAATSLKTTWHTLNATTAIYLLLWRHQRYARLLRWVPSRGGALCRAMRGGCHRLGRPTVVVARMPRPPKVTPRNHLRRRSAVHLQFK